MAADDDLRREIGQLGTASVAKGLVLIAYIRQRMVRSRPMWTVESAHSYASAGSEAAGRQAKLSGNLAISIARALEASSSAGRIRHWRSGNRKIAAKHRWRDRPRELARAMTLR